MFQHILIPLDFTEKNDRAVEVTCGLAGAEDGRVTLLHVIEALEDDAAGVEIDDFYDNLATRARRKLGRLRADLANLQVTAEIEVTVGNRAEEIVRCAVAAEADLIVMSSRPLDPERGSPRPWPTISHKVAMVAPCPVLLVR